MRGILVVPENYNGGHEAAPSSRGRGGSFVVIVIDHDKPFIDDQLAFVLDERNERGQVHDLDLPARIVAIDPDGTLAWRGRRFRSAPSLMMLFR